MDGDRRRRFVAWFKLTYGVGDGARTRFMEDSGKRGDKPLTKGRVAQLFDEGQPFGERAARQLAQRFGLADDYFLTDMPGAPQASLSPEALRIALQLDRLRNDPKRREIALAMCEMAVFSRPQSPPAESPESVEVPEGERRPTPQRLPSE